MDMVRVRVASCLVRCRQLSTDELVDAALGTIMHKTLILILIYISIDVDDVAPPRV